MWNKLQNSTGAIEWLCVKILFSISCFFWIKHALIESTSISTQKGFCILFSCNLFVLSIVKTIILAFTIILLLLYVMEKKMLITTFLLFLVSFIAFSVHESFGIQNRTGIVVLIWLAQFIAYFLKWKNQTFDLKKNRIFFSIQVIVACYTLSALSKLYSSGLFWFWDSEKVVLQMLKANQTEYLDGNIQLHEVVSSKILFVIENGAIMSALLLGALLIELTCGLGLMNKKMRLIYGFLLLSLHIGIDFFFGIVIDAFYKSMIIFMINPLYLIYLLINKIPIFRPKSP